MSGNTHRVLITGATGMLGANLAHRLVADGVEVHALVRKNYSIARLHEIANAMHFHAADLENPAEVREAVMRSMPDIVYHLASTPFNPPTIAPENHYRTNVLGTLALVEALTATPGAKFIYTGTAAVYGPSRSSKESDPLTPSTLLGASKAAASALLQTYARIHGVRTVELRLFTPYGPWEHPGRLIPQAIVSALDGIDLPMSHGSQERDYVYVEDVIDALLKVADTDLPAGSVFNIGSGIGTPVSHVVERVFSIVGTKARPLFGVLPTRPDEIMYMSADVRQAHLCLSWQPQTTLQQGLEKAVAWVKANRNQLEMLMLSRKRQAA